MAKLQNVVDRIHQSFLTKIGRDEKTKHLSSSLASLLAEGKEFKAETISNWIRSSSDEECKS